MRNSAIKTSKFICLTITKMGEAKRRKEKGLPPRTTKKDKKVDNVSFFQKLRSNQILPIVLALGFVVFLIVDLIRYYNQ